MGVATPSRPVYEQTEPLQLSESEGSIANFRVGTCHGQVVFRSDSIDLLTVINNEPGNGHFDDVLYWFALACRKQKKTFRVIELWNERLYQHLITKRGFSVVDKYTVEKDVTAKTQSSL